MPKIKSNSAKSEDIEFKALRALGKNPAMSQRDMAKAIGVSLGAAHYCLMALIEKGFVKMHNFNVNPNKLQYAYLLTPEGIAHKLNLTANFLKRKKAEYLKLRDEIDAIEAEYRG